MKKSGLGNESMIIIGIAVVVIFIVVAMVLSSSGSSSNISSTGSLKIGDPAPQFTLPSTSGNTVALSDYEGKPVVLYFNEGVGCQPCWQQIIDLEKDSSFTSLNIPMVTISPNELALWNPILRNNPIKSPILADTNSRVSSTYGMLTMKSSMHNGSSPGHTFLLLDKDHKVRWIGDYPAMNMPASDIITAAKN